MQQSEATRLEELWAGDFGDQYVERNRAEEDTRRPFWKELLTQHKVDSILEIGCNMGGNLQWIREFVEPAQVYAVEINKKALAELRGRLPDVNANYGQARALPFRDAYFEMTFTTGVLIHQPEETLPVVMGELFRCSSRYILIGEYFAEQTEEVHYRGNEGALFRRDYGGIFRAMYPELKLVKNGFLGPDDGWDDVTYWLFEK